MQQASWLVIWRELRGERARLILSFCYFVVKHSPVWVLPLLLADVINTVVAGGVQALVTLAPKAALFAALLTLNVPLHTLHVRALSQVTRGLEVRLRTALVRKLQELSLTHQAYRESGRFHAKFVRDVEAVEGMISQSVVNLLPALLALVYVLGVSASRNALVSLFFLLAIPFVYLLTRIFGSRMNQKNRAYRSALEALSAEVSRAMHLLPLARAHATEEREITTLEGTFRTIRDTGLRLDIFNALFGSATWTAFQLFNLGCLVFTAQLASRGEIPVGDIVLYQGFFNMLLGAISTLFSVFPQIVRGLDSVRSISEVLDSPDIEQNEGKPRLDSTRGHFVLEGVSYRYPNEERWALADLSFEVTPGEVLAIVGPSGSGKTTLMHLLIGLMEPTIGAIRLDGVDLTQWDRRSYRQFLSVVDQRPILFSGTVRDNVRYAQPTATDERVWHALELAGARTFVDAMPGKLDARIGEDGATLSGGQQQRLTLARALLRDPRILILDEPTSALDPESRRQFEATIGRIVPGRTVLIVSHDFSAIRCAHRVLVLEDGRARELGTAESLLARPSRFSELAESGGIPGLGPS